MLFTLILLTTTLSIVYCGKNGEVNKKPTSTNFIRDSIYAHNNIYNPNPDFMYDNPAVPPPLSKQSFTLQKRPTDQPQQSIKRRTIGTKANDQKQQSNENKVTGKQSTTLQNQADELGHQTQQSIGKKKGGLSKYLPITLHRLPMFKNIKVDKKGVPYGPIKDSDSNRVNGHGYATEQKSDIHSDEAKDEETIDKKLNEKKVAENGSPQLFESRDINIYTRPLSLLSHVQIVNPRTLNHFTTINSYIPGDSNLHEGGHVREVVEQIDAKTPLPLKTLNFGDKTGFVIPGSRWRSAASGYISSSSSDN